MRGKTDTGRGISLRRFREDLLFRNFRQLSDDLLTKIVVRQHPDTFRRKNGAESIDGLLNERTVAEETEDLLRYATRRLRGQKRVPRPPARIRP